MDAEKVAYALVSGNAGVTALVPLSSIYPKTIGQGTPLPAISITFVDGIELPTVDAGAYQLHQARISIEAHAGDYAAKKQILKAVRTAMRYQRGIIAGVTVASIVGAGDGPDIDDTDVPIYRQSIDFLVTFRET